MPSGVRWAAVGIEHHWAFKALLAIFLLRTSGDGVLCLALVNGFKACVFGS